MAKSVAAQDLKSCGVFHAGSSPATRTSFFMKEDDMTDNTMNSITGGYDINLTGTTIGAVVPGTVTISAVAPKARATTTGESELRDWDDEFRPTVVPAVVFKTRVRDDEMTLLKHPNPYRWEDKTTYDYFAGKRVVLFSLPGAFTPTCSTYQLPGFENNFDKFKSLGINDIYCVSVNDAFVMNCWAKDQKIKKVKMIPDGAAEFTRGMNMSVSKDNLGFGERSWRYACIVNNGKIEKWFVEPGKRNLAKDDPYGESSPEAVLEWLEQEASR
jgi:thioredoxin-dependent peroxiredoxin